MFDFGVEYSEDLIDDKEWVYTNITEDRIASILKVGSKKHSPPYSKTLLYGIVYKYNDWSINILYVCVTYISQVFKFIKVKSRYSNFISVFSTLLSQSLKTSNVTLNEIAG